MSSNLGKELAQPPGDGVSCLSFYGDSSLLLAGSWDGVSSCCVGLLVGSRADLLGAAVARSVFPRGERPAAGGVVGWGEPWQLRAWLAGTV